MQLNETVPNIFGRQPEKKEEMTSCRIDHYQTVDKVHVSIFAKQVDKERSTVTMEDEQVYHKPSQVSMCSLTN